METIRMMKLLYADYIEVCPLCGSTDVEDDGILCRCERCDYLWQSEDMFEE